MIRIDEIAIAGAKHSFVVSFQLLRVVAYKVRKVLTVIHRSFYIISYSCCDVDTMNWAFLALNTVLEIYTVFLATTASLSQ